MPAVARQPLEGETIIRLKAVASLPCFLIRPNYFRVWQWTKRGARGVRLETRRVGREIVTSVEAVERFLARINGDL